MNAGKSSIYMNGVSDVTAARLIRMVGIPRGQLPFRYLGVPITTKRLNVLDCDVLIHKIVKRIHAIGAKKLSYGGRLALIRAVLSHIHNYWARIFIIPTTVMKQLIVICRNFLWGGV